MASSVVEDTLSFCHPVLDGGVLACIVGVLQFAPWLVAPSLFLDGRHSGSSEIVYRLWLLYLKVFVLLTTVLQSVLAQPVPNLSCVDPFGTILGMPSLGAGVLGVYGALTVALRMGTWHAFPSPLLLATLLVTLVLVPVVLVIDGLHTDVQVLAGLAWGVAYGAFVGTLTNTVLTPLLVPCLLADPDGLGRLLGSVDTYLRPPQDSLPS